MSISRRASAAVKLLFPRSNHHFSTTTVRSFGADQDNGDDGRRRRGPPDPIPNRPLRGDRPSSPSPRDASYRGRGGGGRREGRPVNSSNDSVLASRFDFGAMDDDGDDHTTMANPFRGTKPVDNGAGASFLEKFKLGFEPNDNQNAPKIEPEPVPVPEPSPPEDADEIFKKMKENGLIPNAVAMLDGLCKDGLVQEAMKLFGLMREKGTIPEVVIYTAVVQGFCKAYKFDDAKRIFRKMQKNGISPNAFSYTVLIQGLCKGRRLDDAVEFSVEMLDAGHSPNVATLTDLVDVFCKDRGVEEAQSIVRTLREKNCFINEKAIREHLDKKGPFSPLVWEAVTGKKSSQRLF